MQPREAMLRDTSRTATRCGMLGDVAHDHVHAAAAAQCLEVQGECIHAGTHVPPPAVALSSAKLEGKPACSLTHPQLRWMMCGLR
jgi:hypothetical protein